MAVKNIITKKSSARKDIKSVLIIGSGPIVIGQACEFDYSGNQAVQALREEGYKVIVHNPNPASVMTIADTADVVYMEPLDIEHLCAILDKEKPDAILPTMGGQTALNLAMEFYESKLNETYHVEFIGASITSIKLAEDRGLFKERMTEIGLESPFSSLVHSEAEAFAISEQIGFPLIIRPSFTLGGQGGGIVYTKEELKAKIRRALSMSPTRTALIEESLLGYQEFEFEVVRDAYDNALIVCAIENMDPMGIHTGDSITVAPIQTLSDQEYQLLRKASIDILRAVEVECGGSNVQLAYHPEKKRMLVIEMNPRVSRSSALASKATGFPIARCAAKLAVGFSLDEIINEITGKTTAFFEPSIDYVAVKVPRFDTKKFKISELGTQMRSVGEALSLARTFPAALNKAVRSIEIGLEGLEPLYGLDDSIIDNIISTLHPKRLFAMYTKLLKEGESCIPYLKEKTHFHPWFLYHLLLMAQLEQQLAQVSKVEDIDKELLQKAKEFGFSDVRIARIITKNNKSSGQDVYNLRVQYDIHAAYHCVDTCAGEFEAKTPYFYSSYGEINEGGTVEQPAVAIIGSGPNRIGQGLEFDTCCTMATKALRDRGYKVVMINCNPETVSTDFNISDRLYIEPLNAEDVYEILKKEKIKKVIFQLGGQTPINLLNTLEQKGIEVMSGNSDAIDEAEHRDRFSQLLTRLGLNQMPSASATSIEEIEKIVNTLGYPILVRPSYVIGGQSMMVLYTEDALKKFVDDNRKDLEGMHMLVDKFLEDAIEYDVDAVSDGDSVYIGGILEHIEQAGIHSGDSACVFENFVPQNEITQQIKNATYKIATSIGGGIKGLVNIQFAQHKNNLYVLEVNPRASRTVPFISKVSGVNLVEMAADVWNGKKIADMPIFQKKKTEENPQLAVGTSIENFAVKEAVFSFDRFDEVDPILTPEMRSTGESIGIGESFGEAFAKASAAASTALPIQGTIFISIARPHREKMMYLIDKFISLGFNLVGTQGTAKFFNDLGRPCRSIYRVTDGSPNVIDEIQSGKIDFVVNILEGVNFTAFNDDKEIRTSTIRNRIPYITTTQAVGAALEGIDYLKNSKIKVRALKK